jgi:hypothetical protein
MDGPQIAQRAKEQISGLTGLKADTISGLAKDDQGWHVAVDLVEMKRIPDSSDMLAIYEVQLDTEGHLLSYKRTRRYRRDETMAQED